MAAKPVSIVLSVHNFVHWLTVLAAALAILVFAGVMSVRSGAMSDSKVEALLRWRNPVMTGLVFASGNMVYFLTHFTTSTWKHPYNLLTVACYVLLVQLIVGMVYVKVKGTASAQPTAPERSYSGFGRAVASDMASWSQLWAPMQTAINGTSMVFTVKIIVLVFVAAQLSKILSASFILYLGFLGAFLWPKIHENLQKSGKAAAVDRTIERLQILLASNLKPKAD